MRMSVDRLLGFLLWVDDASSSATLCRRARDPRYVDVAGAASGCVRARMSRTVIHVDLSVASTMRVKYRPW